MGPRPGAPARSRAQGSGGRPRAGLGDLRFKYLRLQIVQELFPHMYLYMYICIYTCIKRYVYIYMYIHTYNYSVHYVYIYIYFQSNRRTSSLCFPYLGLMKQFELVVPWLLENRDVYIHVYK